MIMHKSVLFALETVMCLAAYDVIKSIRSGNSQSVPIRGSYALSASVNRGNGYFHFVSFMTVLNNVISKPKDFCYLQGFPTLL